jgi:hypothetical protein
MLGLDGGAGLERSAGQQQLQAAGLNVSRLIMAGVHQVGDLTVLSHCMQYVLSHIICCRSCGGMPKAGSVFAKMQTSLHLSKQPVFWLSYCYVALPYTPACDPMLW